MAFSLVTCTGQVVGGGQGGVECKRQQHGVVGPAGATVSLGTLPANPPLRLFNKTRTHKLQVPTSSAEAVKAAQEEKSRAPSMAVL